MRMLALRSLDRYIDQQRITVSPVENLKDEDASASAIFAALRGYAVRRVLRSLTPDSPPWTMLITS